MIGQDIFELFSSTYEQNSAKLDRNEDLNVFFQIKHFCLLGRSENQDGRPDFQ